MKRSIIYITAATFTFSFGVVVATLHYVNRSQPMESPPSQIAAAPSGAIETHMDLAQVFHDFDFVGSIPIGREYDFPHGLEESVPFPQKFEAGKMYAFHRRGSTDIELLYEALENRFRAFGVDAKAGGSAISGMRVHLDMLSF